MPDPQPPAGAPDAPSSSFVERLAESVIHEFHEELQEHTATRRRSMARKYFWGTQPLWLFGVGLMLLAGLLLRGDDRWIMLAVAALMLAIEVGLWRPIESKRGLLDAVLGTAVGVSAIARLAESVDDRFTVNHVYLVLALVGAIFAVMESIKRGTSTGDADR